MFPGIKEWNYPNSCSNNNNGNISIKNEGYKVNSWRTRKTCQPEVKDILNIYRIYILGPIPISHKLCMLFSKIMGKNDIKKK